MAKWEIDTGGWATEIHEYSNGKSRIRVIRGLKRLSFICATEGDDVPQVDAYDIYATPVMFTYLDHSMSSQRKLTWTSVTMKPVYSGKKPSTGSLQ